jgi:hypothetical protein
MVGGKILTTNLPDSILGTLKYMGARTEAQLTPLTLTLTTAETGNYYIVSKADADTVGTVYTINGVEYRAGDWAVWSGTRWDKVDNSTRVISVAGKTGAVSLADMGLDKVANKIDLERDVRSATKLASAFTVTTTSSSDVNFTFNTDGLSSPTIAATLNTSGVTATTGAAAIYPITVDAKGRVTGIGSVFDPATKLGLNATADKALQLANARTISASSTSDATFSVSFNGLADVTGNLVLNTMLLSTNVKSTLGYHSFTVNSKGLITSTGDAFVPATKLGVDDTAKAAKQWSDPRTFQLTGDVTTSAISVDGTTNITFNTSLSSKVLSDIHSMTFNAPAVGSTATRYLTYSSTNVPSVTELSLSASDIKHVTPTAPSGSPAGTTVPGGSFAGDTLDKVLVEIETDIKTVKEGVEFDAGATRKTYVCDDIFGTMLRVQKTTGTFELTVDGSSGATRPGKIFFLYNLDSSADLVININSAITTAYLDASTTNISGASCKLAPRGMAAVCFIGLKSIAITGKGVS